MSLFKDIVNGLMDVANDAADGVIDLGSKAYLFYQSNLNDQKPISYQEVAKLHTQLVTIVMKLSNQEEFRSQRIVAQLLINQLCGSMIAFEEESQKIHSNTRISRFEKKQQLNTLEKDFIATAYDFVYYAMPELTTNGSFWGYIAASINAFTQWVAEFNLIPEHWINRNTFFKPMKDAADALYTERYYGMD